MGVPVIDPENPAGYGCSGASSKNIVASSCNCSSSSSSSSNSSCSGNSSSSNNSCSSSSSNSSSSNNSSSNSNSSSNCCCNDKNCNYSTINNTSGQCSSNSATPTLTLTFANRNSCGAAKTYHYNKTEMQYNTPLEVTPIMRHTKDLVGNSKEYRIEHNKCDLRIIGNSNRIRIGSNQGNLQIIGNSTRLKITNNSGSIRYTGNDGRICLGSDSTQQAIDYIGNNGKLKVVKVSEMSSEKIKNHKQKIPNDTMTSAKVSAKTELPSYSTPKKVKVKSASFGGNYSAQCGHSFGSASMPNLKSENVETGEGKKSEPYSKNSRSIDAKGCTIDNNINIFSNYGNICIKNAVNVSM